MNLAAIFYLVDQILLINFVLERLALTVETGTSQSQYSMTAIFKTDATPTKGIIPGASISENIRNGLKYLCTNFGAFIAKCTVCHFSVAMPPHYLRK